MSKDRNCFFQLVAVILVLFFCSLPVRGDDLTSIEVLSVSPLKNISNLEHEDSNIKNRELVEDFYQERNYRPVWVGEEEILPQGKEFLSLLSDSHEEGLFPRRYHIEIVTKLKAGLTAAAPTTRAIRLQYIDLLLVDAFFTYMSDLNRGMIDYESGRQWSSISEEEGKEYRELLSTAIERGQIEEIIADNRPDFFQYNRLLSLLEQYRRVIEDDSWPDLIYNAQLEPGDRSQAVALVRERLRQEPGQRVMLESGEDDYFDDNLKRAILNFQEARNLRETGRIDLQTVIALNLSPETIIERMIINLDRLRWMQVGADSHFVMVNIPEFKVRVIDNNRQMLETRAVVGRIDRQTPVFVDEIKYLIFNPVWYMPESIAVEEYLPEIREDISYLFAKNIRVYELVDGGYREVNPYNIDWDELDEDNFPYYLWQDPGHWNSLGNIIFRGSEYNPSSIYLHDSPERHLFYERIRTYSFGCVRLQEPLELAYYLLNLNDNWQKERINNLVSENTETQIELEEALPLYYVYLTTLVDNRGLLNLHSDVYNRDEEFREVLFAE